MSATKGPTAEGQVRAMLARGWRWHDCRPDVVVHPHDGGMYVVYDRAAGTLGYSPALLAALDLIILTPPGTNPCYWRDDQKAHAARGGPEKM